MGLISKLNSIPVVGDVGRGIASTSLRGFGLLNSGATRNDLFNTANAITDNQRGFLNGQNNYTNPQYLAPVNPNGKSSGNVQDDSTGDSGYYSNAPYTSASGGSYGSRAAAAAADNSYYNGLTSQVNGQIGNLDNQQNIGLGNIANSYNTSLNALLGDQAIAQRNYDTSKSQGLQDYTNARGQNQLQTGQQANSLQRLLGAHGYTGSANKAAGYAAALQGSQQGNALDSSYGRNTQALDTNFGDYQNKVKGQRSSLDQQRFSQEQGLKAQVASQRQGLLGQLAEIANARGQGRTAAGYTNQASALDNQITALGNQYANPVIQATSPVYQAPNLESYTVNQNSAAQLGQPGAASNVSPAFATLLSLGQDKKKGLGF